MIAIYRSMRNEQNSVRMDMGTLYVIYLLFIVERFCLFKSINETNY